MPLETDAVNRGLDSAIDQFNYQNQEHGSDEESALDAAARKPQCERYDEQGQREFLAESGFITEGARKAARARTACEKHARRAARLRTI
jgi:hypothetical protein